MMRRQLAQVPVEKGNSLAIGFILLWIGYAVGWISHDWSAPLYCWYAA